MTVLRNSTLIKPVTTMNINNLDNIYFDKNSVFQFNELNESHYLQKLFESLNKTMGVNFSDYDFYIFANSEENNIPESINSGSKKKKILFYLADAAGSLDPRKIAMHYHVVFKTHLKEEFTADNVYPVPLGYVNGVPELPIIPIHDRAYNVFFSGDLNRNRIDLYRNFSTLKHFIPKRGFPTKEFRKLLIRFKNDFSDYFPDSIIVFNSGFKNGLTPQKYGETLANSKIILSPMGFGNPECFRDFESMRAGCVIISDKLPKTEFYEGSPIIQIEDWKEGLSWVRKLLKDKSLLNDYHLRMIDWWENKCSENAVARYMEEKITYSNSKILQPNA